MVRQLSTDSKPPQTEKKDTAKADDNDKFSQYAKDEALRFKQRAIEGSKAAYMKSKQFKDDAITTSTKIRDQTITKSKEWKDKTVIRSKELKNMTLEKSKELKENITKILPPDIHENIYTLPNFLTTTRLICAPIVGYMILHNMTTGALILFVYSCVTDFFDGLIARHWNLKSIVGSVIDPIADKALMVICTVCLTITSQVPVYLAVLILGRDIMLGLAGVIIRYLTLPVPKTILRYFDPSIITVEVHPTKISKLNTALQMIYLGTMMVKPFVLIYLGDTYGPETQNAFLNFIQYFEYTVATTTLWSGLSYLFSRKAVKILVPWKGIRKK